MIIKKLIDGGFFDIDRFKVMAELSVESLTEQTLSGTDYWVINPTTPPAQGSWQTLDEGDPELINGAYHQQWLLTDLPVESERVKRKKYIEAQRDIEMGGEGSTVQTNIGGNTITWQSDEAFSIKRLTQAIVMFTALGGVTPGFVWRDVTNTNHVVTLSDLVAIGAARLVDLNTIWVKSVTLKAQIAAANTAAEVNQVVW